MAIKMKTKEMDKETKALAFALKRIVDCLEEGTMKIEHVQSMIDEYIIDPPLEEEGDNGNQV